MDSIDQLLARFATQTSTSVVADELRLHLKAEPDDEAAKALLWAMEMVLTVADGDERILPTWKPRYGIAPPETGDWPDAMWIVLRSAVASPAASALFLGHIGHLLIDRRKATDPPALADRALEAFLSLATNDTAEPFDRLHFLEHAFDLAKKFQRGADRDTIVELGLVLARRSMEEDTERTAPGIFARYIDAAVAWGASAERLVPLLDEGIEAYETSPFARPALIVLRAELDEDETHRRALLDAEAGSQIEAACAQGGLAMLGELQQALAFAERANLADRLDEIRRILGEVDPAGLDFKAQEFSVQIPGEQVRSMLAPVTDLADTREAVEYFASMRPLSPEPEKQDRPPGLLGIFPTIHLNRDGLVTHVSASPEQIAADYARQLDGMAIQLWAPWLHEMFTRLVTRPDARDTLESLFDASPLFTDTGTVRVIAAMEALQAGDAQPMIGIIPLLESAVRRFARKIGLNTARAARGAGSSLASEWILLGGLLDAILAEELPAVIRAAVRYWRFLLSDRFGVNLRNDFMHGFREEITITEAALIVHVLLQLATLTFDGGRGDDRTQKA